MLIQTQEQLLHARTVLFDADEISIDTETDGYYGDVIGFSTFCLIKGREPLGLSFYFPVDHDPDPTLFPNCHNLTPEQIDFIKPVFHNRNDVIWYFHNYKYDRKKFKRMGWVVGNATSVRDSMIMSHMEDENTLNSLDACGERLLGKKKVKGVKDIADKLGGWRKVPQDVMAMYAEEDAVLTFDVGRILFKRIEAQEMTGILPVEMQFSECLSEMEERGIRIDLQRAKQLEIETALRMQAIVNFLQFDPGKKAQLAHKLYQPSPEGLGLIPEHLSKMKLATPITLSNGRTIGFIPVMDKATLESYRDSLVALVLEYRSCQKALSTWFRGFQEKAVVDRLHPTFKQHGTVTTRLSCENPNVHQIPRSTEEERESGVSKSQVKSLFKASDGFELWEYDYSQIQFRMAGCYSKEEAIVEGYRIGKDIHSTTAEVLGILRQPAKTVNFLILFGGQEARLIKTMWSEAGIVMDHPQAAQVLSDWRGAFPRLAQTIVAAERAAHRGWIRYWDGRRRHFQYPSEYRTAFVNACQGGEARIMIRSMNKIHEMHPIRPYKLVSQVHDSLWVEIPKGESEKWNAEIIDLMEWPSKQFIIPFPVEAKQLA